ncbi:MAG: sulfurtransferase [Vicinamibacterales bacterium]|nr:sulfurtransferase [Vicinamibacterales bacterium]
MPPPTAYAHPELLVTPAALADRLRADELEDREPPLLLDGRPAERYATGHIAGAVHVDLWGVSLIDTDPAPLRAFLWMIHHVLALRGVREERPVVLVDQQSGLRAARAFWFLEFFGHRQVSVLDGGIDAWTRAGLPLTSAAEPPLASDWVDRQRWELLASWQDVSNRLDERAAILLDTRTDDEYAGRLVRARRGGAIPGAVHVEWTRNLTPEGTFLPAADLRALYESAGVTPDREVITYCQGAYRAAHSYLALRLLGYPRVRVYLGSWKEWGDRDETPVEIPQ